MGVAAASRRGMGQLPAVRLRPAIVMGTALFAAVLLPACVTLGGDMPIRVGGELAEPAGQDRHDCALSLIHGRDLGRF